jgi:hypothetical protein
VRDGMPQCGIRKEVHHYFTVHDSSKQMIGGWEKTKPDESKKVWFIMQMSDI